MRRSEAPDQVFLGISPVVARTLCIQIGSLNKLKSAGFLKSPDRCSNSFLRLT